VPSHYRKTLTLDNGTEMAEYEGMERDTGISIYFAHPYHSWERGSNENANGLLRFYFPKRMDFTEVSQTDLDQAVRELGY
jgi:IS30 family transposase